MDKLLKFKEQLQVANFRDLKKIVTEISQELKNLALRYKDSDKVKQLVTELGTGLADSIKDQAPQLADLIQAALTVPTEQTVRVTKAETPAAEFVPQTYNQIKDQPSPFGNATWGEHIDQTFKDWAILKSLEPRKRTNFENLLREYFSRTIQEQSQAKMIPGDHYRDLARIAKSQEAQSLIERVQTELAGEYFKDHLTNQPGLTDHFQQIVGQTINHPDQSYSSCVMTSALNVLLHQGMIERPAGRRDPGVTEDYLTKYKLWEGEENTALRGNSIHWTTRAADRLMSAVAAEQGYTCGQIGLDNIFTIIAALENGQAVMMADNNHAVCLTGVETRGDNIIFKETDPLSSRAESTNVTMDTVLSKLLNPDYHIACYQFKKKN